MNRTQTSRTALRVALIAVATWNLRAAEAVIQHRPLFFEYGKGPNHLLELDASGKVVWEHKPPSIAVIFQVLPNGNVLYACGGKPTGVREATRKCAPVIEVTRDKKVVWKWADHSFITSLTTVRVLD
jgi:hypothetical protein